MKAIKARLSQEELGVYLPSYEGGLLYNLPFSLSLGKKKPEEVIKALEAILKSHPSLNTQFFNDEEGNVYKKEVEVSLKVPLKDKINRSSWPKEFKLIGHPLYRFEMEKGKDGLTLFLRLPSHHHGWDLASLIHRRVRR